MTYRILALALAGTLTLGLLAGCGSKDTQTPETTPPAVETVSPTPAAPEVTDTPALPEGSPEAAPETTPPAEETPSTAPSQKPSSTPKPTTKPTQTPAPSQKPETTPTPAPQVDAVQATWDEIAKLDLPSLSDMDADTLSALYGIDSADLVSFVFKMPLMNVQATEFFIAEVKDGKMDTVKACVEKRQADLEAQWSQYLPEQLELVQNYQLVTNGNYILFAISEHADDAVAAFNACTK